MKILKYLSFLLVLITMYQCSSDSTPETDYKQEVIKTTTDVLIVPRIDSFVQKVTEFQLAVQAFSTTQNEANLNVMRAKLNDVSLIYAKLYIYNIGEAKNNFMNRKLNFWPVFNISIEKQVQEGTFTQASILQLGSAAKNLPGLNYLIFKDKDASKTLAEYTAQPHRSRFLKLVTNEFLQHAKSLQAIWSESGKNYAKSFKENRENGLTSSFNLLFNGAYNVVDNCKVTKIGKPGGLEKSPHTNPEIVENYYAENSLELVYQNLLSVEEVFFSKEITSISKYIESKTKNNDLNTKVQQRINAVKTAIKAVTSPLKTAVNTEKDNVKAVHTAFKELLMVLHTEVRSTLGIIITGTDNDGD